MARFASPTETRRRALVALFLAALALGVYLPAAGHDFVLYDDDLLITLVPSLRQGFSGEGVAWALGSTDAANWMPLTRLSWLLDATLFGVDPRGFHATNVLLHALATALLFLGLSRLTGAALRSAGVAALFAVHPVNVEAVAWAAARRDVLSAVFAAASLWAFAADRRGWTALWLAAGLLSKPMLVTWPCVLLLLDLWPRGRMQTRGDLALRLREKLPLFALAAASALATLWAQSQGGAVRPLGDLALGVRVQNALAAHAAYLQDAVWPTGLAVFYPHPGRGVDPAAVGLGALWLVGASALAWWQRRRRPWLLVGWLWYVGMLVPVIGLVQVGQAARADRYLYLPLVGLWIAAVWTLFDATAARPALRRLAATACVVALCALCVAARAQLAHWRDSESLFLHALRVTERNQVAHINLGLWLTREGRLDEASSHLMAGLRASPRSSVGTGLLADVRVAQGRTREAIHLYERALRLDPGSERWQKKLDALRAQSEESRR